MSQTRRILTYIVPVTAISLALNIPKFMEVEVNQGENGTYDMDPTETRVNPTFVFWYTVSLIWHPTMTTGDNLLTIILSELSRFGREV